MSESRKVIDARGLACPEPVVLAKKAIEEGGFEILEVLVDNDSARENVLRYASHVHLAAAHVGSEGASQRIEIRAAAAESPAAPIPAPAPASEAGVTILLSANTIGRGDDELGALLMRGFTYALAEGESLPARVILMNSGIRLGIEGSESLANLKKLGERGVDIAACGTCLEFYGLKGKLAVGRVSNMYEIAACLQAGRTLSL